MTLCVVLYLIWTRSRSGINGKRLVLHVAIYLALSAVATIVFWPKIWREPVHNLAEAFRVMSQFPWQRTLLYRGDYVRATELPWHYAAVWIGITTPLSIIGFGCVGAVAAMMYLLKKGICDITKGRNVLVMLPWLFLPLACVILFK